MWAQLLKRCMSGKTAKENGYVLNNELNAHVNWGLFTWTWSRGGLQVGEVTRLDGVTRLSI